jgi:uncharacterized protein (TIGR03089 family)
MTTTPERQFSDLLAAQPSRPFVTYYDEASGERSELSVKSLANWVAKTHHLLATELGLGVGDTALVSLPAHWISLPILLGCLTAGLELTPSGATDVAFVAPTTLAAARAAEVYVIAPESAAVGLRDDVPDGALDYVGAVRPQADKWPTVQLAAGPKDPCLPGLTRADAVERSLAVGLTPGERLLTTRPWSGPDDWIETVLAPLAVGGSLVIVANAPDEAVVQRRMSQERATHRLLAGEG